MTGLTLEKYYLNKNINWINYDFTLWSSNLIAQIIFTRIRCDNYVQKYARAMPKEVFFPGLQDDHFQRRKNKHVVDMGKGHRARSATPRPTICYIPSPIDTFEVFLQRSSHQTPSTPSLGTRMDGDGERWCCTIQWAIFVFHEYNLFVAEDGC